MYYKIGQKVKDMILGDEQYDATIIALYPDNNNEINYILQHDEGNFIRNRSQEELDKFQIWKPTEPEVQEMTVEEISEALGKTVKVVK